MKKIKFLSPNEVGIDFNPIREEILTSFISIFNNYIRNREYKYETSFCMNTSLTNIPELNKYELEIAKKLAGESGWELTEYRPESHPFLISSYSLRKVK